MPADAGRRRRAIFAIVTAAVALAGLEAVSWLGLRLAGPRLFSDPVRRTAAIYAEQTARIRELLDADAIALVQLDTLLGWRFRPGYAADLHRVSEQGLRAERRYAPEVPRGVLRVAAFGDSFVYGSEVATDQAWPAQIEALNPRIEVLNYGVGGYGVDQALLRYRRDGSVFQPRIVVMGFTDDDLTRVVNVYRRFRSSLEPPLGKPRYLVDDAGRLELLPTPLGRPSDYQPYLRDPRRIRSLGEHDQWYSALIYENPFYDWSATVRLGSALWIRLSRRHLSGARLFDAGGYHTASPAFRIQRRLFEEFARSVRSAGAEPLIMFLPGRESVGRLRAGRPAMHQPLADSTCSAAIPCLDAGVAFQRQDAQPDAAIWFAAGGHYSELGNRVIAEWMAAELVARSDAAATPDRVPASRDGAGTR